MTPSKKVVEILVPYLTVFPSCRLNDAGLMVYARKLAQFEPIEIQAAMDKLMDTSKWFPTIAEIMEAIRSLHETANAMQGKSSGTPTAAEAWEEAMQNVKDAGIYKEWMYSHPAVERACMQFGKMELCLLEMDAVNTARSQFMRIYNSITDKDKNQQQDMAVLQRLGAGKMQQLIGDVVKQIG